MAATRFASHNGRSRRPFVAWGRFTAVDRRQPPVHPGAAVWTGPHRSLRASSTPAVGVWERVGERVWRRVSSEHEQPASGRGGIVGRKGSGPAETGSRILPAVLVRKQPGAAGLASLAAGLGAGRDRQPNFPALLVRKQPGAAVLVAEVSHRPPSLNKFRVDRHNPRFAGLILSRAGVRPARDKINPAKRGPPETPFHPDEYLNSKINSVTGWG